MKHILTLLVLLLNLSACSERAPQLGEVAANPLEKSTGIVGGTTAEPSDEHIEHTVLITGKYENGNFFNCSGTVIDEDIILTAAHCIGVKDTMKITFGESPIHEGAIDIMKVKAVLPHTEYEKETKDSPIRNDIALIQMDGPSPDNFAPAVLPWKSRERVTTFSKVIVYGYGITSGVVKNGKLNTKTAGVLRTTQLNILKDVVAEDIFAANQREGKGICSGDSGGPAFIRGNVVVGVISRGLTDDPDHPQYADDDLCNYESIFTRVAYYKTWIEDGIAFLHSEQKPTDFVLQGP